MSTDTYHPKTVWMTQGATHLRCSSGAEIMIGAGGELEIVAGGYLKDRLKACTTSAAASATLDAWGTYALDTSGVYIVQPERGSVCTLHIHSTAYLFFKASSAVDACRFPSSKMRCIKVACSTKDQARWGPAIQIRGMTTHRAYVVSLSGSSNATKTNLIVIETSST